MKEERERDIFSKYLSIGVGICIILGTFIGYLLPGLTNTLREFEIVNVSIPIAIVLLEMSIETPNLCHSRYLLTWRLNSFQGL